MILRNGEKYEKKNTIFCFKNDKNLVNFDPSIKKSKHLHFDWFLLKKVYKVCPKKVERSYISSH